MKNFSVYRDHGIVEIAVIEDFERKNAVHFSPSYKNLLSEHNAVRLENDCFKFELNGKDRNSDISFFGYGLDIEDYLRIEFFQQDEEDYSHKGLIVFGSTAGGDYVCFDYRADPTTDNPPVVVMLHDYPDDNDKMMICPVADNFELFMDSLYEPDEEL